VTITAPFYYIKARYERITKAYQGLPRTSMTPNGSTQLRFRYWRHKDKYDLPGTLIFTCNSLSLSDADKEFKKLLGKDPEKLIDVGVTIENLVENSASHA
jgi:hypothetical protein